MTRIPASLALLALRQSGHHLSAATLRSWVHRGHITRKGTGYDLTEIRLYLERRDSPSHHTVKPCDIEGCDTAAIARGFCVKHYRRFKRRGDPVALAPTVVEISYEGVHARLRRGQGLASDLSCELCGDSASDWAYDHRDPNEVVDDRGRVFSRNHEDHYMPLCRGCHLTFDAYHAAKRASVVAPDQSMCNA